MLPTFVAKALRSEALWIAIWIALGLAIDANGHQSLVDIGTWSLFAYLFARGDGSRRRAMLACLALATVGELVLALGWEIYTYRLGGLPLFVPPGHVLLFLLGQRLAAPITAAHARWLASIVAIAALPLAFVLGDTISLPLLGFFALACFHRKQRALYVVMFVLALLMELWGTALGNWAWTDPAPGTGLGVHNPPLAVGALYVVLDRLVLWTTARPPAVAPLEISRRPRP